MSETSWEWMQQNQISTMSKYSEKGGGGVNHHDVDMHRRVSLPKRKKDWQEVKTASSVRLLPVWGGGVAVMPTVRRRKLWNDKKEMMATKKTTWQVVPTTPEWNKNIIHHQNYHYYYHPPRHWNVWAPPGTTGPALPFLILLHAAQRLRLRQAPRAAF